MENSDVVKYFTIEQHYKLYILGTVPKYVFVTVLYICTTSFHLPSMICKVPIILLYSAHIAGIGVMGTALTKSVLKLDKQSHVHIYIYVG